MSDDHALARLDATAQAELVRQREITPEELTEAALSRIGRLDPQLNAVIHDLSEKAHASIAAGLPDGPLRGVPFLVKDAVCQTAGDPYHAGMSFLKERGYVAKHDTELARRFRAAGLVFVGKTNTPELAMSATTEPRAYGPTHNPWRRGLSPGGSSGGSAAAVAAGTAVMLEVTDASVHDARQIQGLMNLPVLASIPQIWLESDRMLRRRKLLRQALASVALVMFVLVGGAANYTWVNGMPGFVEDLLSEDEEIPGSGSDAAAGTGG